MVKPKNNMKNRGNRGSKRRLYLQRATKSLPKGCSTHLLLTTTAYFFKVKNYV